MPNTLEQFYSYLAGTLYNFFDHIQQLKTGEKYFLYLEKPEAVAAFYQALIRFDSARTRDFEFRHAEGANFFQSKSLRFNETQLILATPEQATENYLTTLRNQVSAQQDVFQGTAILILFSGKLDSLIGGSGQLTKSGMPFNYDYFYNDLRQRVRSGKGFTTADKEILNFALKKKGREFKMEGATVFDFASIIAIVQKGKFDTADYSLLGLFPHEELHTITDTTKIAEHLKSNNELFETIESSINYGNLQNDLERRLTGAGIDRIEAGIADDSWRSTDYSDIVKMVLKKDKFAPVNFQSVQVEPALSAWVHAEGSGKRTRHVLIFNPENQYPLTLNVNFDAALRGTLVPGLNAGHVMMAGRTLSLQLDGPAHNDSAVFFDYKDAKAKNVKFRFRVWCVPVTEAAFANLKTHYLINPDGYLLIDAETAFCLNPGFSLVQEQRLANGGTYVLSSDEELRFLLTNEEDDDEVPFTLEAAGVSLGMIVRQQTTAPGPIKGWDIWQNKRVEKKSYQHIYQPDSDTFKIILDTHEFGPRGELRANLLLEIQLMTSASMAWWLNESGQLSGRELRLSDDLTTAYGQYHRYIQERENLPSLFYLDQTATELASQYVRAFIQELSQLPQGAQLTESRSADLLLLGTVTETYKNRVVRFCPLHPLMVAYQLELNEKVKDNRLYEAMLKKLSPLNLIPYLKWKNEHSGAPVLYASKENNHSPEWLYYSDDLHFKQFAGRDFVRGLVKEKIEEFVVNFSFLFAFDHRAPIKMNVFHMGDCIQILQGIFDYYKDLVLAGTGLNELRPIELYIHGSANYVTSFELMSHMVEQEDIEKSFNIGTSAKWLDPLDLIDAFRENVRYFALDKGMHEHYAHLSFYQFDNSHAEITYRNTLEIPSGLSLEGLLSDIPSYHNGSSYITGFGSESIGVDNALITLTKGYNALAKIAFSQDPFEREKVVCTSVSGDIRPQLEYLYDHSQWVTFVDPKFDLSFFKDVANLIIIHYSDQYSNASGFDAITVSRKSKQYKTLLKELLDDKKVDHHDAHLSELINLYNAINGQWLIKLISSRKGDNVRKEKLSIPSALKAFLAFYDHPGVTWVPVSLEEILRISGGAGLSKTEGLFSTKNLGAKNEHSDDLLMLGLFELNGELHLQLYPLEVKIGQVSTDVKKKARLQAQKTYDLIYDHLTDESRPFEASFYRNFFAKLAIMNASKMSLYDVWEQKDWEVVTKTYRSRLLNNQFKVSRHLVPYIGKYAVAAFSQAAISRSYVADEEGGRLLEFLEDDGYQYLIKNVDVLIYGLLNVKNSVNTDSLLIRQLPDLNALALAEPSVEDISYRLSKKPSAMEQPPVKTEVVAGLHASFIENQENNFVEPLQAEKILLSQPVKTIPAKPIQIALGTDMNAEHPVIWYPSDTGKVMHTNTGIIGTMGTGKTQFTKSLITQLHRQSLNNLDNQDIGILIFDYKGDYIKEDFKKATGAEIYKLHHLPFNPLAIDVTDNAMPLLPLHIAATLQETIATAFGLGPKQKAFLKEMLMSAYEQKGIIKNQPDTWTRQAPTIADVCERYFEDERASMDSLHAALQQLYEFEIFQPVGQQTTSLFEMINGVTVINLSGYPPDVQNLVVAITLDSFYSQMQKSGHSKIDKNLRQLTKMILVDEADNFLSKNFQAIRKILKEGREFGVGTILSTQFLNHFSTGDNDYDQYILTWIVHRVNDVKIRDIDALFSLSDREQKENLIQLIKGLEKHHSVVNLAGSKPIFMEDNAFWKLIDNG